MLQTVRYIMLMEYYTIFNLILNQKQTSNINILGSYEQLD